MTDDTNGSGGGADKPFGGLSIDFSGGASAATGHGKPMREAAPNTDAWARNVRLLTLEPVRETFWKEIRAILVQVSAGSVVRRELRGRAAGRRLRQVDLTDPVVDLLPELGMDRAVDSVTAVLTAMVTYGVTVWIRGTSSVALSAPVGAIMSGGRYGYFPVLLIFSAVVVVVDDASERPWLQALVLVPTLLVLASSLWLTNPRSDGPPWDETVRAARAECRADPTLVEAQLPISPKPAWWVVISCDRLR